MPRRIEDEPTEQHFEKCPTCGKELRGIRDYPLIFIKDVQRLPIPDPVYAFPGNENIRDQIVAIAKIFPVEMYISAFESAKGTAAKLSDIEHHLLIKKDEYFKNHFRLGKCYIGLWESEKPGVAEVALASEINLGSAGGPQLVKLAGIAEIQYEGQLLNSQNVAS